MNIQSLKLFITSSLQLYIQAKVYVVVLNRNDEIPEVKIQLKNKRVLKNVVSKKNPTRSCRSKEHFFKYLMCKGKMTEKEHKGFTNAYK